MSGLRKTVITILLASMLLALMGCQPPASTNPDYIEGFHNALELYQQQNPQLDSWWELVALYGAGIDLGEDLWVLPPWTSQDLPAGSAATTYAGFILGLLAQEQNPWDWEGRHLPAELASLQLRDGSFGGSVNNTIWAMLALDVTGFPYSLEEAIAYLGKEQKDDGGYALSGSMGDSDVTSMAMLALSFHRDNPAAEVLVERSREFLKEAMLPSGGFTSYNEENANSTAVVISALISLGEDITADPWQQDDGAPLKALLAYQLEEGSFSFFLEPLKADNMATYQALIALGDVVSGTSVFVRLQETGKKYREETTGLEQADPPEAEPGSGALLKNTPISLASKYEDGRIFYTLDGGDPWEEGLEYTEPMVLEEDTTLQAVVFVIGMRASEVVSYTYSIQEEKPATQKPSSQKPPSQTPSEPKAATPTITVHVRVVGESKVYFNSNVKVPEDKANALQALLSTGKNVKVGSGGFVQGVEGEVNAGVAGWKYKVNNTVPGVSALNYTIKEGDSVLWWYADTPDSTGP